MNDNELSFETLYVKGLGWSDKTEHIADVPFDGELDYVSKELASAENLVEFTDMYSKMEAKNASDKIYMLKKLNIHYGRGGSQATNSIENFLYEQSIEADADEAAAKGETSENTEKKDIIDTSKINNKFVKFLATAFNAIANFIRKIFDKIIKGIKWLINELHELFTNDEDLSKINSLDSEQERIANEALAKSEFEHETNDNSKYISLKGDPSKNLLNYVNSTFGPLMEKIAELCEYISNSKDKEVSSDICKEFNTVNNYFSTLPGVQNIPQLNAATKEDIEKYNKELNLVCASLNFDKWTVSYCKYLLGTAPIKPRYISDITGTSKIKDVNKVISHQKDGLKEVGKAISKAEDRFKYAEKYFNDNLESLTNPDNVNEKDETKKALIVSTSKAIETTIKMSAKLLSIVNSANTYITSSIKSCVKSIKGMSFWKKLDHRVRHEGDEKIPKEKKTKEEKHQVGFVGDEHQ